MADPRSLHRNEGLEQEDLTYPVDTGGNLTYDITEDGNSAQSGLAVTLTASGITLVADGEPVLGELIMMLSASLAVVRVKGMLALKRGTSATITLGNSLVGAVLVAAEGYVRDADGSTAAEIQGQAGRVDRIEGTDDADTIHAIF